jgi:hypothetical protein
MVEASKTAIALDEAELLELARIMVSRDEKEAFNFLKKSVYDKVARIQQGKGESHVWAPVEPQLRDSRGAIRHAQSQGEKYESIHQDLDSSFNPVRVHSMLVQQSCCTGNANPNANKYSGNSYASAKYQRNQCGRSSVLSPNTAMLQLSLCWRYH